MRPRHIERGVLVVDEQPHRHDLRSHRRRPELPAATILPLPASVLAPARRPRTPSMRGIENPQMSASSTPTVSPRAASAAARFAVTDDLPTPPLPLPTAMHACRGRHLGGGCAQLRFAASALHERRAFFLRHLAVVDGDLRDAREARDLGLHVGRDLAPERAGRGRERHLHADVTVRRDVDVLDHPEVDDADVELRIEDAREHAAHVVRGGGRRQRVDHLLVYVARARVSSSGIKTV